MKIFLVILILLMSSIVWAEVTVTTVRLMYVTSDRVGIKPTLIVVDVKVYDDGGERLLRGRSGTYLAEDLPVGVRGDFFKVMNHLRDGAK